MWFDWLFEDELVESIDNHFKQKIYGYSLDKTKTKEKQKGSGGCIEKYKECKLINSLNTSEFNTFHLVIE